LAGDTSSYYCLIVKNTWQKISRYYNRRLAAYGLSVPKALLLLELSHSSGMNPGFLSKHLDLDSSSMTGLLSRMEKIGLIERRADPKDRRGVQVFLTDKGLELQKNIYSLVGELDKRIGQRIPRKESAAFRRVMTLISKELSNE
jgi:DNA-binding MarR family transcriptional regulator